MTTHLNRFRELALYEQRFYGKKSENEINQYPILFNYLIYTFYRLTQEKGKVLETEEITTFNTGLVDRRYEPIYALFKKSKYKRQKWEFSDFCIAGENWAGKTLVRQSSKLPELANDFKNTAYLLYDLSVEEPKLDYRHIIVENTYRLPLNFLEDNVPQSFVLEDTKEMSYQNKKLYFEQFCSVGLSSRQRLVDRTKHSFSPGSDPSKLLIISTIPI